MNMKFKKYILFHKKKMTKYFTDKSCYAEGSFHRMSADFILFYFIVLVAALFLIFFCTVLVKTYMIKEVKIHLQKNSNLKIFFIRGGRKLRVFMFLKNSKIYKSLETFQTKSDKHKSTKNLDIFYIR